MMAGYLLERRLKKCAIIRHPLPIKVKTSFQRSWLLDEGPVKEIKIRNKPATPSVRINLF